MRWSLRCPWVLLRLPSCPPSEGALWGLVAVGEVCYPKGSARLYYLTLCLPGPFRNPDSSGPLSLLELWYPHQPSPNAS